MKHWLRRVPLLLALLGVVGLLTFGFWPKAVRVEVVEARQGGLQVTVNDDGKTRIREKYIVSAPVGGKLLRVDLEAGDGVEQDRTVLARIEPSDPSMLDARAVAEAEARVRAAEAAQNSAEMMLAAARETHELARHEFERARDLIGRQAISQAVFDQAEHQERIAQANFHSAEFDLRVANFELDLARAALIRSRPPANGGQDDTTMTIRSPIHGAVLRVLRESAGIVSPGEELLELGDPHDLEMEIDVLSVDAVRIKPGAEVFVEHWGGTRVLKGAVRLIEPSAFLKISALGVEEQRVNVIADFLDPPSERETLGDAFRIEARIVVDKVENTLKVPSGVLFRESGHWKVFRVQLGRARLQTVEVGRSNDVETEIRSGIDAGDLLILHPTDRVQDGVRVRRQ